MNYSKQWCYCHDILLMTGSRLCCRIQWTNFRDSQRSWPWSTKLPTWKVPDHDLCIPWGKASSCMRSILPSPSVYFMEQLCAFMICISLMCLVLIYPVVLVIILIPFKQLIARTRVGVCVCLSVWERVREREEKSLSAFISKSERIRQKEVGCHCLGMAACGPNKGKILLLEIGVAVLAH